MDATDFERNPSVVVIGAGMTGILLAIKLREAGITDITILEKKGSLGGTWRENTYPGVACDVPAHMYTYSFERNAEWSHRFAHGNEIRDYFEGVAAKYGVTDTVRFNEAVVSCVYRDGRWHIETSKGASVVADFVVSATGILHHPARPDIPGLESFGGVQFHTAEWNHDVDLRGKRIGVIGTGSTAAQAIPELMKIGGKVSVFQRTAQWIFPLPDKQYTEEDKERWRKNPSLMDRLSKRYAFAMEQLFSKAVIGRKIPLAFVNWMAKRNLKKSVRDPELRKKLTPDYRVGCKRLVINSTFYDAIQQPNADLVTEGIERIEERGVITSDGRLHELDVLVLSTGFKPFNFMRPMDLVGRDGVTIDEAWSRKAQAYRSTLIPGFPNFILMLGPNAPIGNFSVIAMSEVQTKYVIKLIDLWRTGKLGAIEATQEATRRFNSYLKAGMANTVWVGGCRSWYLDADGDPALWPYSWKEWVAQMATPDLQDLRVGEDPVRETVRPVEKVA